MQHMGASVSHVCREICAVQLEGFLNHQEDTIGHINCSSIKCTILVIIRGQVTTNYLFYKIQHFANLERLMFYVPVVHSRKAKLLQAAGWSFITDNRGKTVLSVDLLLAWSPSASKPSHMHQRSRYTRTFPQLYLILSRNDELLAFHQSVLCRQHRRR